MCCQVAATAGSYLALEKVACCPVLNAHANEAAHHDDTKGSGEVKSNACAHSTQQTWGGVKKPKLLLVASLCCNVAANRTNLWHHPVHLR